MRQNDKIADSNKKYSAQTIYLSYGQLSYSNCSSKILCCHLACCSPVIQQEQGVTASN